MSKFHYSLGILKRTCQGILGTSEDIDECAELTVTTVHATLDSMVTVMTVTILMIAETLT